MRLAWALTPFRLRSLPWQDALDLDGSDYLVTESIAVCEAACATNPQCAGFVHVAAGLPYSGGPTASHVGVGSCFFRSDVVTSTFEASAGVSCHIRAETSTPAVPGLPAPKPSL